MDAQVLDSCLHQMNRVFHNEEDFRLAFTRKLEQQTNEKIRPEFRYGRTSSNGERQPETAIDLIALAEEGEVAIELKYPKDTLEAEASINDYHDGISESLSESEIFDFSSVGAYDMAMYPFWKDVSTLENLVASEMVERGYVLQLTNYADCWSREERGLNGDEFLLYRGREVSDETLRWAKRTAESTKEEYPPLEIDGEYHLSWTDYDYSYPENPTGETKFKYLLVEVSP